MRHRISPLLIFTSVFLPQSSSAGWRTDSLRAPRFLSSCFCCPEFRPWKRKTTTPGSKRATIVLTFVRKMRVSGQPEGQQGKTSVGRRRVQLQSLCRPGLCKFLEMHLFALRQDSVLGWSFAMGGRLICGAQAPNRRAAQIVIGLGGFRTGAPPHNGHDPDSVF
jgi:hypothetical protein